jgi:hemerythrin-like domain-containing protein
MQVTDTLRAEHEGVLTVLAQLERAVSAAEAGRPIPRDIFADVQEFFAVFVDRCHHGKEEGELFPALGKAGRQLQEQIEEEHHEGRDLAAAYAAAVGRYQPGNRETAHGLAVAARAYAAFLQRHIALENTELLPLVERTLSPERDHAVWEAFERLEEERIGAGTHERLHGMIATLAPRIDAAA